MNPMDWAEMTVLIRPLARKLEEHLNRHEYRDAEEAADQLSEITFELKRMCINNQVKSGIGYNK